MARLTLAQVAAVSSPNIMGPLIEANTTFAPEWGIVPVQSLAGTSYNTLVRTALPTVDFQNLGAGVTATKSQFALRKHDMFFLKARVEAVKEIAEAWDRESGIGSYFANESSGVVRAAMQRLGSQMFYGTAAGTDKGFQGLKAFAPFGGDYTLNAEGTAANTASSIYLTWLGLEPEAIAFLTGNNTVFQLPAPRLETITVTNADGSTGNADAYTSQMDGYSGLRIGSPQAVVRICNVTAETGKKATDALLARAWALFPVGYKPTAIFMSRRSQEQLEISRSPSSITVLNGGGEALAAPPAVSFRGVPIIATDSILNTDAIES